MMIFNCPAAFSVSPSVRIKDIATIKEVRENQLMGFGLVVGLHRTGDSQQTEFTKQALTNLLARMGMTPPSPMRSTSNPISNLTNIPQSQEFRSKNVAAVMVTANLPAFQKPGKKIDVIVSSVGDATSLKGGTLLSTPLMGADGNTYAVAQGALSVGDTSDLNVARLNSEVLNTARIPDGAIVERAVPVDFQDNISEYRPTSSAQESPMISSFTILLNNPDFTTASRVFYSIAEQGIDARADDAGSIVVIAAPGQDIVSLISQVENTLVVPDVKAKVVINERNGTIVIGENVRISPVAVTYQHISISVGNAATGGQNMQTVDASRNASLVTGASLADLVRSLNSIGAKPKDLIAILQAIKSAGALSVDIEVI